MEQRDSGEVRRIKKIAKVRHRRYVVLAIKTSPDEVKALVARCSFKGSFKKNALPTIRVFRGLSVEEVMDLVMGKLDLIIAKSTESPQKRYRITEVKELERL